MALPDYDDEQESTDTGDDSGSDDECVQIAGDILDAVKKGDKETLASALKQFIHYENSEPADKSAGNGHGLLIALGPKKG